MPPRGSAPVDPAEDRNSWSPERWAEFLVECYGHYHGGMTAAKRIRFWERISTLAAERRAIAAQDHLNEQ